MLSGELDELDELVSGMDLSTEEFTLHDMISRLPGFFAQLDSADQRRLVFGEDRLSDDELTEIEEQQLVGKKRKRSKE